MPKADIEVGRERGRLVQITIRPTTDDDDGQLGYDELMYAAREIQMFARTEYRMPTPQRSSGGSDGASGAVPLRGAGYAGAEAVEAMVDAYNRGGGKVTDEYLARLAVAYGELAPQRRDVSTALAVALGKPIPTVKGHIMRARKEKHFLSEAVDGKEGGVATDKARELIAGLTPNSGTAAAPDQSAEINRLKAEVETWQRLAEEYGEELDKSWPGDRSQEPARAET